MIGMRVEVAAVGARFTWKVKSKSGHTIAQAARTYPSRRAAINAARRSLTTIASEVETTVVPAQAPAPSKVVPGTRRGPTPPQVPRKHSPERRRIGTGYSHAARPENDSLDIVAPRQTPALASKAAKKAPVRKTAAKKAGASAAKKTTAKTTSAANKAGTGAAKKAGTGAAKKTAAKKAGTSAAKKTAAKKAGTSAAKKAAAKKTAAKKAGG